ncbi:hypothetical protein Rsub_06550 [Raphidocelis subcapitata]|uniref:Uncharacterized protein n=1 Tax=Raphidocelis subcapitata TaxID=307507 RepID=A0A2V0P8U2_9CHLO|nr:hypothetical protein Rsub_06550 [Raphidocelis subcapitata]|eukprot:GBF94280.1 hypothetical protein Rsub_06550 [Raphidocelis subcapitata]
MFAPRSTTLAAARADRRAAVRGAPRRIAPAAARPIRRVVKLRSAVAEPPAADPEPVAAPAPADAPPAAAAAADDAVAGPAATAAAAAAAPDAAAGSDATAAAAGGRIVRVAKASPPGKLAGYLLARFDEDPDSPVVLTSRGPAAGFRAVRALALARSMALRSRRVGVQFQPAFMREEEEGQQGPQQGDQQQQLQQQGKEEAGGGDSGGEGQAGAPRYLNGFDFVATIAAVDAASDVPAAGAAAHTVRVGAKDRAADVARLLADAAAEGPARVTCVGPAAALVAVRALVVARRRTLVGSGRDLAIVAALKPLAAGEEAGADEPAADAPAEAADAAEAAASAPEGAEGGEAGKRAARRSPEQIEFTVTACDAQPGAAERLGAAPAQRRQRARGRAAAREGGEVRRGGAARAAAGAEASGAEGRDGDTVVVSRAEWEGVKAQLSTMVQQTEALLKLLAEQQGGAPKAP